MLVLLLRTILLFLLVIIALRLMGKRQIGELQPAELVVTILISELASMPMQDISEPISTAVMPIAVIIVLEILISVLSMKSSFIRHILEGNPVIVVENGKPVEKAMRKLRMNINDLTEQLRLNGIFDISTVKYAIMETNGQISILQMNSCKPPCADDWNLSVGEAELPFLIISDGKLQKKSLDYIGITADEVSALLKKKNIEASDIFLMTSDIKRNYKIFQKGRDDGGEKC